MAIRVLAVTTSSDLPETHMFCGLMRAGIHIEVMCSDDAPYRDILLAAGVPVHSLQLRGRFDREGQATIRERLQAGRFHILHAFDNKTISNGLRASKNLNIKFIAYRGIEANVSVFDPISWTTFLHPRVDKIVCVADAIRQYFAKMKFLWWRFPQDKAITIYKGHDLSWYQAPAVSRTEFGIPQDAFVVGCTANERPRKGLPILIDAASMLPADAKIHLLLIGNIDGKKTKEGIATSPLADRIHLTGFRDDAPQVLASCNVCVLPALKREGLPKAIIEGMVYGVAPIVTDSGGSPELIEHGTSGLIIPPGSAPAIASAIMQLYENRAACEKMGAAAKQRIQQNFHASETVVQTVAVYRELLAA